MSVSRYNNESFIPPPIRKIEPAITDILHPYKMGERLDNLSSKYYKTPLLSYIIMCANVEFENEFEIPIGYEIRIPFPLQRVFDSWAIQNEI